MGCYKWLWVAMYGYMLLWLLWLVWVTNVWLHVATVGMGGGYVWLHVAIVAMGGYVWLYVAMGMYGNV